MAAVTIYDVAQNAGVSIKTVSRVLNAEPNVRPAVQNLGYRPNISARGLAGSRWFLMAAFVDAALRPTAVFVSNDDMLIARSRANGASAPTTELAPFEFIVGESTAPPALV